MSKLVTAVQDIAISQGTLTITDAPAAPGLEEIREVLVELGITSLLALPLSDGQDQMGVLLLAQNTRGAGTPPTWSCSKPSANRL